MTEPAETRTAGLPGLLASAVGRFTSRDPDRDGLRRALRAAIVIPAAAALSYAVAGPTQTPVFTLVGSIALLIVSNFPGDTANRALGYCGLGVSGLVLITLGTLAAPHPLLAIPLCFAVGALVSVLGLLSEVIAAGQRATLMTFILPVCIRPPGPLADRLLGWLLALTICVPAALFLFPPRSGGELRRDAARVCSALAARIEGGTDPTAAADELATAMSDLHNGFHRRSFRPVAMTAGSRALVRVVSNLQWLSDRVDSGTGELLGPIGDPSVRVLRCSADVLSAPRIAAGHAVEDAERLQEAVAEHRATAFRYYDRYITDILSEPDDDAAVVLGRTLATRRTVSATIGLTGRIIAVAAAMDSRPMADRLLGRQLPETGIADRVHHNPMVASLGGYLSTRSISVINSLRTGLALALAVLVTFVFSVQNGPWVVLGALSVMRSGAVLTGNTVVRMLAGTGIGIAIGVVVIGVLGVDAPVMWALLPVVAFGSAYVSVVGSFMASQAMFTMMVMVVFNLMRPTGWQVGLVRIEDVLIGAAVGLTVSMLLWPRGAEGAVQRAIQDALSTGARYLEFVVMRVTRGASPHVDTTVVELSKEMLVALRTYGDAIRVYVSESGGAVDSDQLDATNRIPRLRTAADLIADVKPPPPGVYPRARELLEEHTSAICARLDATAETDYQPTTGSLSDEFVLALRADAAEVAEPTLAALPLLTVAANIEELELSYPATAAEAAPA